MAVGEAGACLDQRPPVCSSSVCLVQGVHQPLTSKPCSQQATSYNQGIVTPASKREEREGGESQEK